MEHVKIIVIVIIGAFLNALGLNLFLIPANVYASGFTGIAQLLSSMFQHTIIPVSTGILLLLLNIPVTILGWKKVGKAFTFYSFLSVLLTTVFLEIIPIMSLSDDILLNAVFGGTVSAIGIGFTLKFGASTGGMDIIAMIMSRLQDKPIGQYIFSLNALIVLTAGMLYGWENALYTLVALYVTSRVIDVIHTRYVKLTAMIVTTKGTELQHAIQKRIVRGITKFPAKGAYKNEDKEMLMVVITRYELYMLKRIIQDVDTKAFTNILHTEGVFGFFRQDSV